MAKCSVYVPMKPKKGQSGQRDKFRVCGCNVTGLDGSVFYRVQYSELSYHHERSAKFEDIIPICRHHAKDFSQVAAWNRQHPTYQWQRIINGLRGTVGTVIAVDMQAEGLVPSQMESFFRSDERDTLAAEWKGSIKRLMFQRNARVLTISDWEKIFRDCLDEFTVEKVMNS